MSDLTLKLKSAPDQRLDLRSLTPSGLGNLTVPEIEQLPIATTRTQISVGDVFAVSGTPGSGIRFDGGSERFDFVGADMAAGTIHVDGDVGAYAGRRMLAGALSVSGNAGTHLGSAMDGGTIVVEGNAGDNVAAPRRGERFGMTGGTVVVKGSIGERAGDRMRRGTIITHQTCGAYAGSRMMGGTIWAVDGFGDYAGALMRRGTLIGPTVDELLPTFVDGGRHDLGVLGLLSQHVKGALGDKAPKALPSVVHKYSGDMATIGKGELLLFA